MDRVVKIKLKKGDQVIIRSGRDKGKIGRVLATYPRLNKVSVEGINVVKRHQKPTRSQPQGGIIETNRPLWVSKVGLYHQPTKKAKRVAYKLASSGLKSRVYAGTSQAIKVRPAQGDKS